MHAEIINLPHLQSVFMLEVSETGEDSIFWDEDGESFDETS